MEKNICLFIFISGALLVSANVFAAHGTYSSTLVNEPGLAYNASYTLDTSNLSLVSLTAQATYSSATFSSASFIDGVASTGSVTVVSYSAIHGTRGSDTLTVVSGKNGALAAAKATDSFLVVDNSTAALTGASVNVNGKKLHQDQDWFIAPTGPGTALSIAGAINANTNFIAGTDGSSVTVTAPAVGTSGNAYTLASSSSAALPAATAKFAGGLDAVSFTLNGRKLLNGLDWSTGASSTNTASAIATAASGINGFTATVSSNVVTISCVSSGTFCNAYTLASSSVAALAAGGANFTGGVNSGRLAVNGTVLTEGTDFSAITSSATTAINLASAINANSVLSTLVTASTTSLGVVGLTSTHVGKSMNYSLWSSAYSSLTPFATAMKGGTDSAVITASGLLHIPSHGYTSALAVLYASSAGTSPQDLASGTTYYVISSGKNDLALASTSAKAQAGTADIRLSTQTATGGGSFTLTPLAYAGTASWKWQVSTDNSYWSDLTTNSYGVSLSSVTYSSPSSTPATTSWNLGRVEYPYYRLNVTAPTAGGLKLSVVLSGKQSNAYRP